MSRTEAVRWRGAARRVLTVLAVLVAALPSAAAGAAAASPPPPADMGLLVARLGRLEAAVREQARETREARADAWALERRVAELEAEREDASTRRRAQQPAPQPPDNASLVHLHRATVSYASPSAGAQSSDGDGHRRAQQTSCGPMRFMSIQTVCCDEPAEDCSGGAPASCLVQRRLRGCLPALHDRLQRGIRRDCGAVPACGCDVSCGSAGRRGRSGR
jgi:hypothetical protein